MKMAGKAGKGFTVCCRKKAADSDAHYDRGGAKSPCMCGHCHAVYRNKRWYADPGPHEAAKKESGAEALCPACLRIREDVPGGIVTLKGAFVQAHKQELLNLIRNEEMRARGFNPLERVMSVRENGSAGLVVSTTNEKLAQRIGRAVRKAFHGVVAYRWSRENKLVRVEWERAA